MLAYALPMRFNRTELKVLENNSCYYKMNRNKQVHTGLQNQFGYMQNGNWAPKSQAEDNCRQRCNNYKAKYAVQRNFPEFSTKFNSKRTKPEFSNKTNDLEMG